VQNHAAMVFATARRITGDASLAEDVAQETFLELSRKDHHAVDSVAAWLHRVAWRKACNAVRSESRRRRHEKAAAETSAIAKDSSWKELGSLIDNALEELPSPLKALLVEHYLQGCSQQEMASSREVSQSTISRQLEAGVSELRAHLRSKGVPCGTGLAALLGAQSAEAAPASLQVSLGKLALSGVGAGAPGTSTTLPITASLLTMSLAKITVSTVVVAGLIAIPFVLHQRGQQTAKPAKAIAPPPTIATVFNTPSAVSAKATSSTPRHYRPPPVTEAVRLKIDAIIRRQQRMSQDERARDSELQQVIVKFFATAQLDSPEMKRKVDDAGEALMATKSLEHGTINMHFGSVDSPEFRTWLEAALSDDTQRAQDWILSRLQGAAFEFSVNPTMERTSDGVKVQPAETGIKGAGEEKKEEKMNF
jgi:RNA polymerase sigma factor (sigma-70 family)